MTTAMFRNHIRLFVGVLAMGLVFAAMFAPPAVHSVAPAFIDAPTGLAVTATSSTGITLAWNGSVGADHYLVERSDTMSGPFLNTDAVLGTTASDAAVSNTRAYVYRVRAITSSGTVSPPSNMAAGTAITFQFDQLGGQVIAAQQFYDVRTAINALRAAANLPLATWGRSS